MIAFEEHCQTTRPDAILVVGDVNSTLACSIVAKKLKLPVAHVEAGLRSGDMGMPEEINRLVTDSISDWFFVTEPGVGSRNLLREGKDPGRIHHVRHVMVDNLLFQAERLVPTDATLSETTEIKKRQLRAESLAGYGVVTLHRPSNVDDPRSMEQVVGALRRVATRIPLIPDSSAYACSCSVVLASISDHESGSWALNLHGIPEQEGCRPRDHGQRWPAEEPPLWGFRALTAQDNTERPITVAEGTNVLVGTSPDHIVEEADRILRGEKKAADPRCGTVGPQSGSSPFWIMS